MEFPFRGGLFKIATGTVRREFGRYGGRGVHLTYARVHGFPPIAQFTTHNPPLPLQPLPSFLHFHRPPNTTTPKCLAGASSAKPPQQNSKKTSSRSFPPARGFIHPHPLIAQIIRSFPQNRYVPRDPRSHSDKSLCADCPCDNDNYIRRANARLGIFLCF